MRKNNHGEASSLWNRMWEEYRESVNDRKGRRVERKKRRTEKTADKMRKIAKKKESFLRTFIGIFIPVLVFSAALCVTGTIFAYNIKKNAVEAVYSANDNNLYNELYTVCEEMQTAGEDFGQNWVSRVKWMMTLETMHYDMEENAFNSDGAMLLDTRDLSVVADASGAFWISFSAKGEEEQADLVTCFCVNDELKKMAEEYDRLTREYPHGIFRMEVEDCYYRDNEIIPGRFAILDNMDIVYGEYDTTPEVTDGYTHITSEKYRLWCVWTEGKTREEYDELLAELMADSEAWDSVTASAGVCFTRQEGGFNRRIYNTSSLTVAESGTPELLLITVHQYNLARRYGKEALLVYLGAFALTVLLSLMLAFRSHFRYQAQLRMERYRRDMTNMMAHDLKSPLMVVSGYAQNLRDNVHGEKRDYYVEKILENVSYMDAMIHNMLNLAKVEGDTQKLKKESISLYRMTGQFIDKYQGVIADKGLEIRINSGGEEADKAAVSGKEEMLFADSEFMAQAVENLINNAVKYTPEQGEIFITVNREFYEVRNLLAAPVGGEVKDLWKPFVKGDNSRGNEQGSGIGLTIVKNIAELHGFLLELTEEDGMFTARIRF
ncbi:MAG: HAMP domain-containing histidine kinase [Bacteroidales bacterium]|nr:HAMP domain-containing histidine kinase [Clostridium sp.]MCM1204440.1 HAMP domain-containing histidine kinase [Bacteroidales bacterium]